MVHRLVVEYGQPTDPAAFDRHYRDVHIGLAQTIPGLQL
ncbi:MAG TPA: EthD family reductase, partial [Blastococcus sp.]